jgi:hypothetical protein
MDPNDIEVTVVTTIVAATVTEHPHNYKFQAPAIKQKLTNSQQVYSKN